jgi:hypothetical protein
VPRAIVHIGTHKTGTTTFQRWADLNRAEILEATGFRYYESMYPSGAPSAHFEIALACLRPDLRWVDYHRAMATDASIIPALCEGMGFDRAGIPNWRVPPLNSGGGLTRWVNRLRWRRLRRR